MQYYWSETTKGFYVDGIHNDIPEDAVAISEEKHRELLSQCELGKVIESGIDGLPIANFPVLSNEEKAENIRSQRDQILSDTDWWAVQDRTMSQAEKDYRQALRDVTNQSTFPDSVVWPTL